MLVYPPIARAAHVTGIVIERVTFLPDGAVLAAETISGPPLIAKPVSNRLLRWRLKTETHGSEPCQALIVADFSFGDTKAESFEEIGASIYRISLRALPLVLYSLPSLSSKRYDRAPDFRKHG